MNNQFKSTNDSELYKNSTSQGLSVNKKPWVDPKTCVIESNTIPDGKQDFGNDGPQSGSS